MSPQSKFKIKILARREIVGTGRIPTAPAMYCQMPLDVAQITTLRYQSTFVSAFGEPTALAN